jgi:hypothetical protein
MAFHARQEMVCAALLGLSLPCATALGADPPDPVVERVKALPPEKFYQYIDQLGREKDFKALEALYRADFALDPTRKGFESSYAATVYCRNLDPERAVAFCASLDLGSWAWGAALIGLRDHPRAKVIGYIKQVATSSIPHVRCSCYTLCRSASWDDLLEQARKDLTNTSPHGLDGMFTATVGDVARDYIKHFRKDSGR